MIEHWNTFKCHNLSPIGSVIPVQCLDGPWGVELAKFNSAIKVLGIEGVMSATVEIDPVIKHALKLLHSPNPDSAEKIRQTLDEIIKQRYGSGKMLINTLNKKYIAEESNFPGTIKRQKSSDSRSSASGKNSSPLPQEIAVPADGITLPIEMSDIKSMDVSEEENLKEFGDLACVVCGAMVVTAGNRLVECADCHSLYHQECHKPQISDDDANEQEFSWCCTNCKNKVMMAKTSTITSLPSPSKSSSSHSSSSSSSSSPYYKSFDQSGSNKKSGSSKSSNSSSSSKAVLGSITSSTSTPSPTLTTSTSGNNSSKNAPLPTPHFNVISVDKRLQIMKKKAAKQQESKRSKK